MAGLTNKLMIFIVVVALGITGCEKKDSPIEDHSKLSVQLNPVTQSNDTIFLNWSKVNSPGLKQYIIFKSDNGLQWSQTATTSANFTNYADREIVPHTSLQYKIVAELSNGDTLESNIRPIKTDSLTITLQPLKTNGDSVQLKWSANYKSFLFGTYYLYRKEEKGDWIRLTRIGDPNKTVFTDKNIPFTTNVTYQATFQFQYAPLEVRSNEQHYVRKEIKLADIKAFDVKYNSNEGLIYFFSNTGEIQIFDINADRVTHSTNTGVPIGYCDMGIYNGNKELYVPVSTGKLFIYDALTLAKKDEIQVGAGVKPGFLFYNNGLLFVNTDAWMNKPLRVFSRSGKNLVEQGGFWNDRMIKKIPGSNTEMIELAMSPSGLGISYYSFNEAGQITQEQKDLEINAYAVHGKIFEMFTDNSKRFITNITGNIFGKNLQQQGQLQNINRKFWTYCFDQQTNEIFGGSDEKTIEVFSSSSFQHLRTIATKYYPFRIFKSSTGLISVGTLYKRSDSYYEIPEKLFIEFL
ncbi:hypothetical protein ACLOAU_11500 [Niabella sp. CJ426]|uniref:hypothetical protein n=1 Tax=Niabella sp. CJ426 TaxID=3393740 RepID=UPI003D0077EB